MLSYFDFNFAVFEVEFCLIISKSFPPSLSFTFNNKRTKLWKEDLSRQNQISCPVETDGGGFYTLTLKASEEGVWGEQWN